VVRCGSFDTVLALTAIFGAALNLGIRVAEVVPLIDRIRADTLVALAPLLNRPVPLGALAEVAAG
jgi:hypothetical protein